MSKFTKSISLLGAALAMMVTSIAPANAESTPTLTATEFLASDGYKEFTATAKAGSAYMSTQSGQELVMTTSMTVDGTETAMGTITIQATKTAAKLTMAMEGQTTTLIFSEDSLYSSMTGYKTTFGPENINKVLPRISGATNKVVKLSSVPSEYQTFKPSELFSPDADTQSALLSESFAQLMSLFTFTEVVKSVNVTDPTMTDYGFQMSFSLFGTSMTIDQLYTFDSNSVMVSGMTTTSSNSASGSGTITMKITSAVKNDLVIELPEIANVIDEAAITKMSRQITAEGKSASKATAIVKKATELAKKSKAQLSSKHLADAAKALKYTVTKITNGVKLTATVSGVKGNLCVTAVKGKTTTKNC